MARHTTVILETISNCQDILNAELKKSNRLDKRK